MTEQLKPAAWLIDHKTHCTGIEIANDDRADVIKHWREEGKATPLYEIPEGYVLVPAEPTVRTITDMTFIYENGMDGYTRPEPGMHKESMYSAYKVMIKAAQGEK